MRIKQIIAALVLSLAWQSAAHASVTCVQEGLATLGYDPGPIDGIPGGRTTETAARWATDFNQQLPALSGSTAQQWCDAIRPFWLGAGYLPLGQVEPAAPAGNQVQCTQNPADSYARRISGDVGGDELTLTVSARFGGAVDSLTWRGKEFINIYDHGRQISFAWFLNNAGGCLNPTEPGSVDDMFNQSSSTRLQSVCSSGPNQVTTIANPAYWLAPGQLQDGFCDGGYRTALNQTIYADDTLNKSIEIGYRGLSNVIAFDTTITLARDYRTNMAEIPTGYLTHEFTEYWRFNPATGELRRAEGEAPAAPWSFQDTGLTPPILSTPDGQHAMGAYTAEAIASYEILAYDVPNPSDRTNKWNMVIQEQPAPAGEYHYLSFAIVGTLADVQEAMQALYRLHPTDFTPPEGYVDVANCTEIAGWAWDPKAPNQPIDIEIFRIDENGDRSLLHRETADAFREDLPPVLNDDGRHGYFVATEQVIGAAGSHRLAFEIVNSVSGLPNQPVTNGRVTLDCPALAG